MRSVEFDRAMKTPVRKVTLEMDESTRELIERSREFRRLLAEGQHFTHDEAKVFFGEVPSAA